MNFWKVYVLVLKSPTTQKHYQMEKFGTVYLTWPTYSVTAYKKSNWSDAIEQYYTHWTLQTPDYSSL